MYVVRRLFDEGPIGAVVIACAATALVLGVVALLARRHRVGRDLATFVAAAALAGAVAAPVALLWATRRDLLADDPPWPMEVVVRMETALLATQVAAAGVLVAVPLLATAHALVKRTTRMRWIAAAAVSVLIAGFALADAHRVLENLSSEWSGPASRYAAAVDDCPRAGGVRALLVALGTALAIVAAARRWRARASARRIAGGVAWLAAGALALVWAHPLGEDGDEPVPFWDDDPVDTSFMPKTLPPAPADCASTPSFVTVAIGERIEVDGLPTTSLPAVLLAKRSLATTLGAKEPVIAFAAAPGVDVGAQVNVARGLGFAHVVTLAQRTLPDFRSASAGPVPRTRRVCTVETR